MTDTFQDHSHLGRTDFRHRPGWTPEERKGWDATIVPPPSRGGVYERERRDNRILLYLGLTLMGLSFLGMVYLGYLTNAAKIS